MIPGGTLATSSCSTEKQLDLGLSTGPGMFATDVYSSLRRWRRTCGREHLSEEDPESDPKVAKKQR